MKTDSYGDPSGGCWWEEKTFVTHNPKWWLRGTPYRVAKKYGRKGQDGVIWTWKYHREVMKVLGRLKPGSTIWNPYKAEWCTVTEVSLKWEMLYRVRYTWNSSTDEYTSKVGKPVGPVLDEFIIYAGDYCIYDVEHWCVDLRQVPSDLYERFISGLPQFNREHGYPDYFSGPGVTISEYPLKNSDFLRENPSDW
tara:strand:- start:4240 stop:4821 length:582 start_codon:yes stop_codon:yes gene_type:complete